LGTVFMLILSSAKRNVKRWRIRVSEYKLMFVNVGGGVAAAKYRSAWAASATAWQC